MLSGKEIINFSGYDDCNFVLDVAFSPDGNLLATTSINNNGVSNKIVKIWNLDAGKEALIYGGYSGTFSPDGKKVVIVSSDSTIEIWDLTTRKEVVTIVDTSGINCTAFSADGKCLATGSRVCTAKIWDLLTGSQITTLVGHTDIVENLAFVSNGKKLAIVSRNNTIKLWDWSSGNEVSTLDSFDRVVQSLRVAFSPNGKLFAIPSDIIADVWDLETCKKIMSLIGKPEYSLSLAFSPDNRWLASSCEDKTVKIWDIRGGQQTMAMRHPAMVECLAFSPDGKRLATGVYDQTVKIWEIESGQEILTLKGFSSIVFSLCFSADG